LLFVINGWNAAHQLKSETESSLTAANRISLGEQRNKYLPIPVIAHFDFLKRISFGVLPLYCHAAKDSLTSAN
jgi:hypothetical protein